MPMQWETPKPIESGLAAALAIYVYAKSGTSYFERSLDIPVQELTQEDLEGPEGRGLAIWWSWVKEQWEQHKKDAEEAKREMEEMKAGKRKSARLAAWLPQFWFFGKEAVKEINRRGTHPDYTQAIDEAEKDLRTLIGFKAYAYRKSEYREPPETKHLT